MGRKSDDKRRNQKQIPFDEFDRRRRQSADRRPKKRASDDYDESMRGFFATDSDGESYNLYVDETSHRKEAEHHNSKKQPKQKKPTTPIKRKIRRIISYCTILTIVLIIGVVLSLTVLFKTQAYKVTGNSTYDEADIIDTCGINKNENIFLASKSSAESKLIEKYAYIESVDVSFSIPDTITIDIVEAVPSYVVKVSDTQFLVVSAKGRILETTDNVTLYGLPLFLGPKLTSTDVGSYIEYTDTKVEDIINHIVTVFSDNGYKGITQIDATDTAMMTFTYDNRIKVKLGVPEDISYKVRTAMTIINEKLDLNGSNTTKGELDVSNCNNTKKSYFREQSLIDAQAQTKPDTSGDTTGDTTNGTDTSDGDNYQAEQPTEKKLSVDDWYVN